MEQILKTRGYETVLTKNEDVINYRVGIQAEATWRYKVIYVLLGCGFAFFAYEFSLEPSLENLTAPIIFFGLVGGFVVYAKHAEKAVFWFFEVDDEKISVAYDPLGISNFENQFPRSSLSRIEVHPDEFGPLMLFDFDGKMNAFVFGDPKEEREVLARLLETEWGVEFRVEPGKQTCSWVETYDRFAPHVPK